MINLLDLCHVHSNMRMYVHTLIDHQLAIQHIKTLLLHKTVEANNMNVQLTVMHNSYPTCLKMFGAGYIPHSNLRL